MIKNIKTGNRVEIGFKTDDGNRRSLVTVVEAVLSDKIVLVMMPMAGGAMVKLPLKSGFEARFYSGGSVIVYDVAILEHPVIDGLFLTKLQLNSTGEKIQLRDFFRVNSSIDFNFTLVRNLLQEEDLTVRNKAMTKDLSGGGMSFVTDLPMEDGTEIYANFVLEGEYIVVLGRVKGMTPTDGALYKYLYRCQFLGMSDMEQEKILKFINNQQYRTAQK
ncbi:MAG: flagellar brake protein [Defluviitaleaceae bacterium]|nr:flagellar brake protein [Defluviitaleaceae bacterium]